jgi:polysaccharide chain length determinant protein (PEP-CTERM system associated)
MLPNKKYTPADLIEILKKRAALIVAPAALGLLLALVVSSQLSDVYEAESLIEIMPQRVPESYVRSTVTMKTEDRLDTLSAQVKSRTQLEKMITELDLYKKQRASAPMQDVVELMRSSIRTDIVRPRNPMQPVDSFYLRFQYNDAVMAARVTERLGMLYVDYNARDRGALAQGTNEFLGTELEEAKRRLDEAGAKLQAFRERHSGKLPTQLQGNIQMIQTVQAQRSSLVESLARDRDRQQMLEQLYNNALATPLPAPPPTVNPTANPAVAVTMSPRQQLDLAKATLAQLQTKLSDEHPDVRRARRQVADLEKQVAALSETGAPTAAGPTGATSEELQRRDRLATMRAEIESLGRQIKFKESQEAGLNATIAQYQSRIEAVPGVESEYLALSREFETKQDAYKDFLAKSENARVAENLENRHVSEQFRVLDPPRVPYRPISPMRSAISGGGLVAGLFLGLLVAALLEIRDGSLKTAVDVAQILKLPVIASVPTVLLEVEKRQIVRRRRLLSGTAALAVVAAGVTVWAMKLWQFLA